VWENETIKSSIQIEDRIDCGLLRRSIFGLNIFAVNGVKDAPDPRLVFLKTLTEISPVAAHFSLIEEYETAENLGTRTVVPTLVSIRSAYFNRVPPNDPALFLPHVDADFIKQHGDDLLWYDALALYIGSNHSDEHVINAMKPLLGEPIPEDHLQGAVLPDVLPSRHAAEYYSVLETQHKRWLHATLDIYSLVVLSGGDGDVFHVYTTDEAHFELLAKALAAAVTTIDASDWYRRNHRHLVWDADFSLCWKLEPSSSNPH
jgi:hypothetical protein